MDRALEICTALRPVLQICLIFCHGDPDPDPALPIRLQNGFVKQLLVFTLRKTQLFIEKTKKLFLRN